MSENGSSPWLTLIGIGEDGLDGLCPAARDALDQAEIVFGGGRHLALARVEAARASPWPSPIHLAFSRISGLAGRKVAVLASGDPFFHGIGSLLAARLGAGDWTALPAPSSYALAAARLGWAGQDCVRVSLHGRPLETVLPHCRKGGRVLALSWDGTTPARLAALLAGRGLGRSRLVVLEALGGPRERVRETTAAGFDLDGIDPLNLVALDIVAEPGAWLIPRAPGLPDDWFENDGQITKREVRALTLSALRPQAGMMLWDVGAGSGSVAIEWMLADPACRAVAVEADPERAARVGRNALAFGVPGLSVVVGPAPGALADLEPPDAIFIGGGSGDAGVVDACMAALKPGGRLVINAVTLETRSDLVALCGAHGGDLVEIAISRLGAIGGFHAMRPALPILQWSWTKPAGGPS